MSELTIDANERGQLRVFALSDPLAAQIGNSGSLDALRLALGVDALAPEDVQIVQIRDLNELGLSGLLKEGYDVALSAEQAARMDALEGTVALIRSPAFGSTSVTLRRTSEAKLVTTLSEGNPPAPHFTPLDSDAAKGVLTGPAPDPAPKRSTALRITLIALAAMVAAFLWVFLYYIGF